MKKYLLALTALAGFAMVTPLTPVSAQTTTPTGTWVHCANEGAICKVPAPAVVRYGANNKYNSKQIQNYITCSNANFGDPIFGVVKTCDYLQPVLAPTPTPTPVPSTTVWTKCADENQLCSVVGTANVRYGVNTTWSNPPKVVTNSILCTNGNFGDPVPGIVKICQTDGTPGTAPVTPPPPATQTCPDGTVIPTTQTCPAPVPPPSPTTQVCPDGSIIPTTQVCPVVMPTPSAGYVTAPTLDGLPDIPTTDFVPSTGLASRGATPTNVPDNLGAERFICAPGQVLADDPIVFPGQPGRSHLHQFYGNTGANANSTYFSLRTSGHSTCSGPDKPLNRTAYWMAALLDGKGNVIRPNYVAIYYKRYPKGSVMCNGQTAGIKACLMQPNGLKWVIGRNMQNWNAPMLGAFHWSCTKPSGATLHKVTGDSGAYPLLGDVTSFCTVGWQITQTFDAPDCWNGLYLDTPDHQSHLAPGKWYTVNGKSIFGCPSTHAYKIPQFKLSAAWEVLNGEDPKIWSLSCDAMSPAGSPVGSCSHLDLWDAWDSAQKRTWTANCLDGLKPYPSTINYTSWAWAFPAGVGPVSGQGGDQCNLTQLTGAQQPAWGFGPPPYRLIPIGTKVPVLP